MTAPYAFLCSMYDTTQHAHAHAVFPASIAERHQLAQEQLVHHELFGRTLAPDGSSADAFGVSRRSVPNGLQRRESGHETRGVKVRPRHHSSAPANPLGEPCVSVHRQWEPAGDSRLSHNGTCCRECRCAAGQPNGAAAPTAIWDSPVVAGLRVIRRRRLRICPVMCVCCACRPHPDQLATHVVCSARRGWGLVCCALS